MKLTPKQTLFVKEYLVDLNATQAAIRAGYSEKTAYSIGEENLKKPVIAQAIQEGMDKRAERVEITADEVLRDLKELRDICMGRKPVKVTVISNIEGAQVPFNVEKIIVDSAGAKGSLELLGRHLKLFTDKV